MIYCSRLQNIFDIHVGYPAVLRIPTPASLAADLARTDPSLVPALIRSIETGIGLAYADAMISQKKLANSPVLRSQIYG
jgi:hypothetical protein